MGSGAAVLLFAIQGGIDTFVLACPILRYINKFDPRPPASISASSQFYHPTLSLADRNARSPPRGEVTDGLRVVHSDSRLFD